MASEKNITMRQFNGTDYDTLYPKTRIEQVDGLSDNYYTKDQTLADGVKSLYELDSTATPNDIFAKLALPANYYGFKILVLSPIGGPVSDCVLPNVFVDMRGNTGVKTGADGTVYCGASTQTVTFNLGGNYFGITNKEYTITADTSVAFTPVTINLVNNNSLTSMTLITQSISYSLLDNIDTADFCAVGGGGGGGSEVAGGGGGGYAQNLLNYSLSGTSIRFTIGGGGGPSSDSYNYDAGSGGRTTIAIDNSEILGANGGGGARKKSYAGGTGNGNGGYNSTNATNGTVRVFNDSSLPLPGGGGAGSSSSAGQGFGGSKNSAGGVPGGGASQGNNTKYSGGAGGVYVRVRYKS